MVVHQGDAVVASDQNFNFCLGAEIFELKFKKLLRFCDLGKNCSIVYGSTNYFAFK